MHKKRIIAAITVLFVFSFGIIPANADTSYKTNDEIIPEIIRSVSPSIVGIIGNLKDTSDYTGTEFSDELAHGTGVIIGQDGLILTNAHVVKDMDKIVVVLTDGSGYEGKLQCIDEESDLATVKIEKKGLKPAKFGSQESIIIGKTVIAIGTPISFSLRNSASIGIISGINRGINSSYRLIQTDAAINPGNSGGPLVNLKGEVIGINSSKFIGNGVEGMGFSIPVNTVNYVVGQFAKYKEVRRPYLGTVFEEDWAAKLGLPSKNGLSIISIEDGSPAKAQGLLEGDILISVNESAVNSIIDYNEEMKKYAPESTVNIKIKRNGVQLNIKVKLGAKNN